MKQKKNKTETEKTGKKRKEKINTREKYERKNKEGT